MAAPGSQQGRAEALVVLGGQGWWKGSDSVAPEEAASLLLLWAGSPGWFCPLGTQNACRHWAPW